MTRIPTPEQSEAVRSRSRALLLEAGAGTGKTGVLVDRYCDLIDRDGHSPDEILAFTFTDRAAAQLRERIRTELQRRATEGGDGGGRLREVVASFGGTWITTIHGFCRRLLAAHPVAAGIDPSFRVLDAAAALRASRAAFDAALDDFLADDDPEREATVAAYRVEGLREVVAEVHAEMRSRGVSEPALPPPPELSFEDALESLERCATAAVADGGGGAAQQEKIQRALELAAGRRERLPTLDELAAISFGAKAGPRAECLAALKRATSRAAEREGGATAYAHVAELLRLFDSRFEQAKAERSGLDFEDLQLLTVRLLNESDAVRAAYSDRFAHLLIDEFQDTNDLQLKLIGALRGPKASVLEVGDEFQSIYGFRHADVEVFRRQREELGTLQREAGPERAQVLPLSGNFRSRPEVIAAANAMGGSLLPNFRPLTVGSAEQAETGPAEDGPAVELLVTEPDGWEDLELDLPVDDRTAPRHVAEARFLAARLRELTDAGVPRSEIVVLLRATTRVDAFEEALDRAGLAPYVVGGRGYWSQQQVGDLLCLLGTVANPLDDERLLGALSSPACGVSPDTLWLLRRAAGEKKHLWPALERLAGARETDPPGVEWLEHVPAEEREAVTAFHALITSLREAGTRLGLEDLVERAVTDSGYDLAALLRRPGRMRMANVRKLMTMARQFEEAEGRDLRGFLDFAEFSGDLDDEAVAATEAEDHDGVRVMTIHTAKGLEFGVVAVPDLDRDLLVGGFPPAMRLAPGDGGSWRVGMRLSRLGAPSVPLYEMDELTEERRRLDAEEGLRLFYVAITRARRRLILSSVAPKNPGADIRPGSSVTHRLYRELGIDGTDGQEIALPAPAPRQGLDAAFPAAELRVSGNSPSPEQAAELIRAASGPAPEEPAGEGTPPIAPLSAPVSPSRPLSYSALSLHRRCGYRYFAERVLGLAPQQPAAGGDAAASRSERFGFGNAAHALLQWSAAREWTIPGEELAAQMLAAEGVEPSAERVENAIAGIRGWAGSALCSETAAEGTRLRAEAPLLLDLAGSVVRGSIDLLAEPAAGPPLVVDYKTDRLEGAEPEEVAARYEIQRDLYAVAVAAATGAERVRVAYVFLERPGEPAVSELGPDELAAARAALEGQVAAIANTEFEVTDSPDWPLCHDCPARARLCPSPAPPPSAAAAAA